MHIIDIIILILLLFFTIRGYVKGFTHQLFTFLSLVVSIGGSIILVYFAEPYIKNVKISYLKIILYLTVFIILYLICLKSENFIYDLIDRFHLEKLDRFLGSLFGLLIIMTLVFCIAMFIYYLNFEWLNDMDKGYVLKQCIDFVDIFN